MPHAVDTTNPVKYQQLAADIRSWLDQGMFQPGEAIPSIADLAIDRGWARTTCARAVQEMVEEGRLELYAGKRYYVVATGR